MNNSPLPKLFREFEREAFRLESLPRYKIDSNGEYAEFLRYMEGGLIPNIEINREWYDNLDTWKTQGKRILRVRVLPAIPDPYLGFEVGWYYPHSAEHGEEIFVLGELEFKNLFSMPLHDFWIFDQKQVGVMLYDTGGEFLGGAEPTLPVDDYLHIRNRILEESLPLKDFLKAVRAADNSYKGWQ